MPVSQYGRSKVAGEQLALKYADAVPITVVRPGIVFGAEDRGMVELFKLIARWGLHVLTGPDDRHVSLVAVADLVECLVLAAEHGERLVPGISGHGIYFAASEDISYIDLGHAIARALGKPLPRSVRLPAWSMRTIGRLGDVISRVRQRPDGSEATRSARFSQGRGRARRRKRAETGLDARGPTRRSVASNGAVVLRRALDLGETL